MKKTLLAAVSALAILGTGAAIAADLPSRSRAPVAPAYVPPAFTWTGFYVGVNAGYSFGRFTQDGRLFNDPDGFSGGGQIGYNQQFGQFVAGLEADFQGADLKAGGGAFLPVGSSAQVDYFGTVRGRLGVAFDRALIYATGGYAFVNAKVSIPGVVSDDNIHNGYALGAGIEYALTNNLTLRGEYMYIDVEKKTFSSFAGAPVARAGADFSTVRAAVNYKF